MYRYITFRGGSASSAGWAVVLSGAVISFRYVTLFCNSYVFHSVFWENPILFCRCLSVRWRKFRNVVIVSLHLAEAGWLGAERRAARAARARVARLSLLDYISRNSDKGAFFSRVSATFDVST